MSTALRLDVDVDLRDLARVGAAARQFLAGHGVDGRSRYLAELAIEEAVSNVIRHGGVDAARQIAIELGIGDGYMELHVADPGRAFDPLAVPEPQLDVPLEARCAGGLGILLLRRLTSQMHYERVGDTNHLRIRIAVPPTDLLG